MRRWIGWVALAVITLAGAVWAGSQLRTSSGLAAETSPPPPSVVDVAVRPGPLTEQIRVAGTAEATDVDEITLTSTPEGRAMITSLQLQTGDQLHSGDVLAHVSGRPVFVLAGAFGAYRDMELGMSGPDVEQLRDALDGLDGFSIPTDGPYDETLAAAIARLYAGHGLEALENGGRLPASEVAFLAEVPVSVTAVLLDVGDEVDGPIVSVGSGTWRLTAPASPLLLGVTNAGRMAVPSGRVRRHRGGCSTRRRTRRARRRIQ
ncbi:hypothetical protein [Phytoactinopolyspora limicola]|uniref:hypothetical protein n=1 Tax=Phytoactinopolyspora limicola TaxID=2715536 RepID=UPI00140D26FC|nr:hypothetical protein [Phytoactinopolyspora limicola]